jgi:hypothetical protein
MPQGIEAPASVTAEGPTSHTQNQAEEPGRRRGELSKAQIAYLLRGLDPMRVGKDGKGFAHVEAWDIRRHLIRVFGFGGHDTDLLESQLIAETSIPNYQKKGRDGKPYGQPFEAWTVVYRVAVRLSVKVDGIELGHWHGIATGDATNQPSRADAHDLALKTADSQALKRAATNLGDQFGLSLYNKGSMDPVVQGSLAYLKQRTEQQFKDSKVEPEPDVAAARAEADASVGAQTDPTATASSEADSPAAGAEVDHLARLRTQALECWSPSRQNSLALGQIVLDAEKHGVADADVPLKNGSVVTFRELLNGRIAEMERLAEQAAGEQRAA